jgi:PLP dependent protein
VTDSIAQRYARLRAEIPAGVVLLGVSKKQPVEAIREAAAAGLGAIGENYVQEAKAKFAQLGPLEKHYIGHIQTNKAKALVELFDVVQSVDRADAARALGVAAEKAGKRLRVLIQVNISPTERFGAAPGEALAIADVVRGYEALTLDGVMAIGPVDVPPQELLRAFEAAAKTFGRIGGTTLSIGMSGDWREAVAAGSTMVRIGTALFGARREG